MSKKPNKKPVRRGAKGKFHEWRTEDGLIKLESWARDGLVDEQIATKMGIATGTLYEYKKKFSDIDEALKRGKEIIDMEVENSLLKRAKGYEFEEVKTIVEDVGGKQKKKMEKTIRHITPDVTAQIFWLKNRKPGVWRDKQDLEHSGTTTNKLDMSGLTNEGLNELVKKLESDTKK